MANNVDKSVYQAPTGLDQDPQNPETSAMEIQIEDPESISIGVDGMEVTLD